MAERPYAHLYHGLPAVQPRRWRWLMVSAVVVVALAVIAVPVLALAVATHSVPSSWWGGGGRTYGGHVTLFDWHSLAWIGGTYVIGGLLGFTLVRGWWSMVAVDAVALALILLALPVSGGGLVVWFLLVFGVSAGVGVRHLIHRRQVLRASFVSPPTA